MKRILAPAHKDCECCKTDSGGVCHPDCLFCQEWTMTFTGKSVFEDVDETEVVFVNKRVES